MRGHGHRVGVAVGEHARRPLVRARALHRGHVVLDRRAQDRVREADLGGAGHEAGALELGERVRRGVLGHVRRTWPRP